VKHFQTYLSEGETAKVLRYHQREIARLIDSQMQEQFWEETSGYETKINAGFTELKPSVYTVSAGDPGTTVCAARQEQHGEVPVRGLLARNRKLLESSQAGFDRSLCCSRTISP
jgi:hypothetical protein